MEIQVAKSAGFCFGVERAVSKTLESLKTGKKVFTWGPIVHNETVISELSAQGVTVLNDLSEIPENAEGVLIIRAHGIPRSLEMKLREYPLEIVDATCPFVKKIHQIVYKASMDGQRVVVFGDKNHPEVIGISGWCMGKHDVVKDLDEFEKLGISPEEKVTIVAQTTFNHKKFHLIVEMISQLSYNTTIVDTVCNATEERQSEAEAISAKSDLMLVIGSSNSSNSQKLYDICNAKCNHTYFIQTLEDLNPRWLENICRVGITAGASTPKNIIEEVQTYVRKF